ncbi:MAG: hypothetical protein KY461_02785 [Actinobacteria bacterium]|nr:hypothetical protein [Actinomycetota bacterium]
MYATATTHLPHPIATVVEHVFADVDPSTWLPELHRLDAGRWDEPGARAVLRLGVPRWSEPVVVTTTRVVRTTVTATGVGPDGATVEVCLSLSPWDGGTAVLLSVDAEGRDRPLLSWSLTRRLEAALVRLAGELAGLLTGTGSAAGRARP